MPNQLINETSPYLLQHADNPVEWYPWGEEALELAREQNKPILLSIGYAACHWCHVMAYESFEDEDTATLMNVHYVNIKVDREERPDLDNIYMQAVQAMTGSGGWPMTVFLTPDGQPFYGGTYFPPEPRYGMLSFRQLLVSVADAWKNRGDELLQNAEKVTEHIQQSTSVAAEGQMITPQVLASAISNLTSGFDRKWGGFGQAPKFPQPMVLEFLLRDYLRTGDVNTLDMAEVTLQKMASGGIYDQVGGGFARYSTDERWLVPHFEKMLYDNAQLARVYLHAWQITGNPLYRRITEETLNYVLREMTHAEGGFYSSQDADSEGVEGKFYVWSAREIQQALGGDASLFMTVYDVSEGGNWEGHNIMQRVIEPDDVADQFGLTPDEAQAKIEAARQKMYQVRSQRVWPGLDDKVLTAWNGLMLAAFAEAGRILGRQDYLDAATRNAEFLYNTMRTDNGRLLRTWKDGSEPKYNAYLEDYAYLAEGLLALYQTTFDKRWFTWARELVDLMLTHFLDEDNGGFFDTSDDHEALLQRPKDLQDNAVPSGNAMAVHALLMLSLYTGSGKYWDMAEGTVSNMASQVVRYPYSFGEWLNVANFMLSEPVEIALIGDLDQLVPFLEVVRDGYRPNQVAAAGPETDDGVIPLLAHRSQIDGMGTAYVCRRFVCQKPIT
ncbi:MAG: thioredoxin domain-containing protein, partial [Chloroflexota bacterium]|nr:thioredoxin domain-containing protein [Chloroflexota bacterium]